MNVYILLYEHKHGADVSAYSTHRRALEAAYEIAHQRVVEEDRWTKEDQEKFQAFECISEALDYFHKVELDWNYSENLEIHERPLVD